MANKWWDSSQLRSLEKVTELPTAELEALRDKFESVSLNRSWVYRSPNTLDAACTDVPSWICRDVEEEGVSADQRTLDAGQLAKV